MAHVLERRRTASGEFVLRRADGGFEILVDGAFAMASHLGGRSEQHQVDVTLTAADRPSRVLIGGLGLGFALRRAVAHQTLTRIVVVEIEPVVVAWHHRYLAELTGDALADPRVTVVEGDVAGAVMDATAPYDALLLDVDNGPDWLLRATNARLYRDPFLRACARATTAAGAVSIWAERRSAVLVTRLRRRFADVAEHDVEVPRGHPDWIAVARRPRRSSGHAPAGGVPTSRRPADG